MGLINAYHFIGAIGFIVVLFGIVVGAIVAIVSSILTLASIEVLTDLALCYFPLFLVVFISIVIHAIIIIIATPFSISTTFFILGFVFVFMMFIVIITIGFVASGVRLLVGHDQCIGTVFQFICNLVTDEMRQTKDFAKV